MGREFKTPTELAQGIKNAETELHNLQQNAGTHRTEATRMGQLRNEIAGITKEASSGTRAVANWVGSFSGPMAAKAYTALGNFQENFNKVSKSKAIAPEEVRGLMEQLANVRRLAQSHQFGGRHTMHPAMALQVGAYAKGIGKLNELSGLQAKQILAPDTDQRIQRLQSALRSINPAPKFEAAAEAIGQAATDSRGVASSWQAAAEAAQSLAESASETEAPAAEHRAFGGYLAAGGQPRGVD